MIRRTPVKRRRTGKARRGRVVDKPYLAWIASQPCAITGEMREVTIHHVRRFGEPKNDRRTIPLAARLHLRGCETPGFPCVERGKKVFEAFWKVDLEELVKKYETEGAAQSRD